MKKSIFHCILVVLSAVAVSSCDNFLDVLPDNRAEVDTVEKVQALLSSAYPIIDYATVSEFSSDNVNCSSETNPNTTRFLDQLYAWEDVTESQNSDPEGVWESCYSAIAAANAALDALDKIGEDSAAANAARGEALLCRAYSHFILVNMFSMHFNPATASKDLGVVYMTKAETTLNPQYTRNSVAEVYDYIDKDLQAGLPLVSDEFYSVPKYHFNQRAAYAFACRFYLYYQNWDKAIDYADRVLGSSPKSLLRDYEVISKMTQDFEAICNEYIKAENNCNLLINTSYSVLGLAFGPYAYWSKYTLTPNIIDKEMAAAKQPWGVGVYYSKLAILTATNVSKALFMRLPYLFEYVDPVAQTGYVRTVIPVLTTDECLLNRAEAYILKNNYAKAAEDMNLWIDNVYSSGASHIDEKICKEFYDSITYSNDPSSDNPLQQSVKKHLNPAFTIDAEGSEQEAMLQAVLMMRRIETAQLGLRWFDVKRYGIEIARVTLSSSGYPEKITDRLLKDDPRRAIQLPLKVINAGQTPNPR